MTTHIIEIPVYGSVPLVHDKDYQGRLKWLLEEAEWVGVHFNADGDYCQACAQPPCPVTTFESKEAAEVALRRTQRREEVIAAATNGALNPYLKAGRVVNAATLQVKEGFLASVKIEKRAAQLDLLREREQKATVARKTEENEIAQIRGEVKDDFARVQLAAKTAATDWASLGGYEKIQHRRRTDGTQAFRARVAGETSESFQTLDQATAWRDEHSTIVERKDDAPPALAAPIGRAEGSSLV